MKYRAVIFDMYETLVTQLRRPLYYGTQIAGDSGLSPEAFLPGWRSTEEARSTGRQTFDDVIASLMKEHGVYTPQRYRQVVEKRFATAGYNTLVTALITSMSSTAIQIASRRYWYPLICAGTPIS